MTMTYLFCTGFVVVMIGGEMSCRFTFVGLFVCLLPLQRHGKTVTTALQNFQFRQAVALGSCH